MTEQIAEQGVRDGIQRRAQKEQPLTVRQKQRNQRLAKQRARVEHVLVPWSKGVANLCGVLASSEQTLPSR